MEETMPEYLKGHFLMAMPGLADPNFARTVTCICEHTSEGAIGVIINRIHPFLTGKEIFDELKMEYNKQTELLPIYFGGPVHMGEVFVIHGPPFEWAGCVKISSSLAMSNTRDILESIARGNGPELFIISLGCAGWGNGQLDAEMIANSWLTGKVVDDIIFSVEVDRRWEEAMKCVGVDPSLLSDLAGHA